MLLLRKCFNAVKLINDKFATSLCSLSIKLLATVALNTAIFRTDVNKSPKVCLLSVYQNVI